MLKTKILHYEMSIRDKVDIDAIHLSSHDYFNVLRGDVCHSYDTGFSTTYLGENKNIMFYVFGYYDTNRIDGKRYKDKDDFIKEIIQEGGEDINFVLDSFKINLESLIEQLTKRIGVDINDVKRKIKECELSVPYGIEGERYSKPLNKFFKKYKNKL